MPESFPFDVFLSHNSKDKRRVRKLANRLKEAGLKVWFDEWNIKSGDIIALKVDEGLEQARVLVLCISPHALASNWVALERSTAVHRDPANEGRRFIPLLLAECDLPDTLRRYKYVDFRTETDDAFDELLAACQPETSDVPAEAESVPKKRPKGKLQTEPLAVPERVLKGHGDWVRNVVVSPDGKLAVSGSWDSTVKVWNLENGDIKATLEGHSGFLQSVAITPNGNRIISASDDPIIRTWDGKSFFETTSFADHNPTVRSVVALPDNTHALSGGDDCALRLWNLHTGSCTRIFECNIHDDNRIFSCAANNQGTYAVSGHLDGKIRLWDLHSAECLAILEGHSSTTYSVKFSPDGRYIFSASQDNTIKIWNRQEQAIVGTLEGHTGKITSISISPDGALIASSGFQDQTVRIWDWKTASTLQVIDISYPITPFSLAFSADGLQLLVGTTEGTIFVYRLTGVRPQAQSNERRYRNAKVVLLGEGTVGKTSLAHRLIEDRYVVHDRTHGMNVWPLDLPIQPNDAMQREALLWDLAGQEDYRLIHQLFLEETALALLLINPQKDDPFREAGDWLKALKTAAGNQDSQGEAVKLLIFSQVDVGGMKLGSAKIERFLEKYDLTAWLPTSAKTGKNCSDQENKGEPSKLKQLIADNIPWDAIPWTSTDRLLADLKKAVMTMRDEQDIRLIRFAELIQRLDQKKPGESIEESAARAAVKLLANHGLVQQLKFGDLVLLQPELLNGYAGAIIRAARAHTDEIGCVLEADIYGEDFDFTGVARLRLQDEQLLLRAMVETLLDHSLCIAEDTPAGRHLVFPSQYRRDKDIPSDPDILVSYTFCGEWQTVWTTLIVRLWYSQQFDQKELWRNAAEFTSGKGKTLGLKIDNQQGEGTATISLYFDRDVPDELKSIFIEYAHRHLLKHATEIKRDRRYVCNACAKAVVDLEAVRKRREAKKDFIYCQACDEKVPLMDYLEQRLKSDPVAAKILEMDATATQQLDTQALEQILIGHMMAVTGQANQIFRPLTMFDYGIDGEVEFKDNHGKASGKRIYIQLKSGNSYLRTRKKDGKEIFDVKNPRHLEYWVSQPVDVYLVIRQTDEFRDDQTIRWMNLTAYLKARKNKKSKQIHFTGEKLDFHAIYKVRDGFFPPTKRQKR